MKKEKKKKNEQKNDKKLIEIGKNSGKKIEKERWEFVKLTAKNWKKGISKYENLKKKAGKKN